MCGNGGRCLVALPKLNVIDTKTVFNADGLHHASINNDGIVSLQMIDVTEININQIILS
jgi:diaminopimelate epimerase